MLHSQNFSTSHCTSRWKHCNTNKGPDWISLNQYSRFN